jgi:hypothetical protein
MVLMSYPKLLSIVCHRLFSQVCRPLRRWMVFLDYNPSRGFICKLKVSKVYERHVVNVSYNNPLCKR